jgi:hypothetical protein
MLIHMTSISELVEKEREHTRCQSTGARHNTHVESLQIACSRDCQKGCCRRISAGCSSWNVWSKGRNCGGSRTFERRHTFLNIVCKLIAVVALFVVVRIQCLVDKVGYTVRKQDVCFDSYHKTSPMLRVTRPPPRTTLEEVRHKH